MQAEGWPGPYWQRLGLTLGAEDFTDSEAVAAVARITNGNFRLVLCGAGVDCRLRAG